MPTISGTTHLKIMKGVAKTPQDSTSAEQGLDEINLLDLNGFSCDEYLIKVPAMKSSAVYADSPLTDGRTLISGSLGNVTETIRLTLNGQTIVQMAALLSKLGRMKADCNDFWDTFGQIEPVYLKHQVTGEPGPRYALLYDIDIDVETPSENPSDPIRTVILNIEREYGWRGIAPGANPKQWTYYVQNRVYTSAGASLTSGIDHLLNATIQNRREWNAAQTALSTQNYFDVPASLIPGDLDALCTLSATYNTGAEFIYFGRTTKSDLPVSGVNRKPAYILNAGDAQTFGTDTTTAADTGAPVSTGAVTNQRGVVSFATVATDALRFQFNNGARSLFEFNSMRGRFVVFARARLSAAGTVTMHLNAVSGGGVTMVYPTQTLTDVGAGGTGNTTSWAVVYMGVVTFPFSEERILSNDSGVGVNISAGSANLLNLYAARTSGAASLYVADLIFIPIDEVAGMLDTGTDTAGFMIDSTGYFLHGMTGTEAHGGAVVGSVPLSGNALTLKPGVQNRILLISLSDSSHSVINLTLTIRLNIVPRWSGLRDT